MQSARNIFARNRYLAMLETICYYISARYFDRYFLALAPTSMALWFGGFGEYIDS